MISKFYVMLSIVVPIFIKAENRLLLFSDLNQQKSVLYEVIVCDRGSSDSTRSIAE